MVCTRTSVIRDNGGAPVDEPAQLEAAGRTEDAFEETRFREQDGKPGEDKGQERQHHDDVLDAVADRKAQIDLAYPFCA